MRNSARATIVRGSTAILALALSSSVGLAQNSADGDKAIQRSESTSVVLSRTLVAVRTDPRRSSDRRLASETEVDVRSQPPATYGRRPPSEPRDISADLGLMVAVFLGLVTATLSGFNIYVTTRLAKRNTFVSAVTAERVRWIGKIRDNLEVVRSL